MLLQARTGSWGDMLPAGFVSPHQPALESFSYWGHIPQTLCQRGRPPLDSLANILR